jgi:hypothetical protein
MLRNLSSFTIWFSPKINAMLSSGKTACKATLVQEIILYEFDNNNSNFIIHFHSS